MISFKDNLVHLISSNIGAPAEQVNLILIMLLAIPLSILNHFLTNPTIRLYYSLIFGVLLQYIIYGYNIIHTFLSSVITYLFIVFYGRKKSPFIILIGSIAYLSFLHIYRMIVDYGGWTIDDPTTIYMMTICKFSSLAFSYDDGAKEDKEFINAHNREYKIKDKPSFIEVLSFVYFYPTAIVGPSIEFKDFIDFIHKRNCYSHLPKLYLFKQGSLYFLLSLGVMAGYALGSPKIPISRLCDADFGEKHNLLIKLIYLYFSLVFVRMKYYSGWTLSYCCLIINGIAYTETTDKEGRIVVSLEKGSYGSIIYSEFGVNAKFKLVYWNNTVHQWLKYNIYTRTVGIDRKPFKNNRTLASLLVFITSALWHGYYPTYYVTFLVLYFFQTGNETLHSAGFYDYVDKNWIMKIVMSVLTQLVFDGVGVAFFNLEWKLFIQSVINLKGFYFVIVFVFYNLKYVIKGKKKEVKKEEKKEIKKE